MMEIEKREYESDKKIMLWKDPRDKGVYVYIVKDGNKSMSYISCVHSDEKGNNYYNPDEYPGRVEKKYLFEIDEKEFKNDWKSRFAYDTRFES